MVTNFFMALLPIPFLQIFCSPQKFLSGHRPSGHKPFTLPLLLYLFGLPMASYTNPDVDWTRLQDPVSSWLNLPQVPHSLAVPFISRSASCCGSWTIYLYSSYWFTDHPLATATGFVPPVGSVPHFATGLKAAKSVHLTVIGPFHTHRCFAHLRRT